MVEQNKNQNQSASEKIQEVLEKAKSRITTKRQLLGDDLAYFYISKRAGDNPPFCLMVKTDKGKKDLFSARRLTLEVATQAMEAISLFVENSLKCGCVLSLNKNLTKAAYTKIDPKVAVVA
jgi:hypothetical protein